MGRLNSWGQLVILGLVVIVIFEINYWDRFYPNIVIGEESVGGRTYQEVLEKFRQRHEKIAKEGLNLTFFGKAGSRKIVIPVSAQGLTADMVVEYFSLGDFEATIQEAYYLGRQGSILKRAKEQILLLFKKRAPSFSYTVYETAIRSLLRRELQNFFEKPIPAQFVSTPTGIEVVPEKIGEEASEDEMVAIITKSISSLQANFLVFSAKPSMPLVTEKKLQLLLDPVRMIVDKLKVAFSYGGYYWRVSPSTLVTWLTIKEGVSELTIDREKLGEFLVKKVAPFIENPPRNSRFAIQAGKLIEIVSGQSGYSADIADLEQKLEQTIQEKQRQSEITHQVLEIKVKTRKEPPKITKETINQYRIKDLVGEARTSFKGSSASRRHNIKTGVSKLNGLLIAPEEEFSAVNAIGFTSEDDGYLKEFVIKGNKSVKESGGGLCQIATTLFRLALNAGLPITARTNHKYVVSYYGPGLDATIYGPKTDLEFINDTGNYLLLQGKVVGDEVVLEFYGQKDGRAVTISEPKNSNRIPPPKARYIETPTLLSGKEECTELPRNGLTSEVTYRVQYPKGETKEQIFKSVYQPWQKVCLRGISQNPQLILNQ